MNQKTLISLAILVGALIIGGVVLSSNSDGEQTQVNMSASSLIAETAYADLGDVDIFGGNVMFDFPIRNEGPDDVVVTDATTSCGCTDGSIGGVGFGMHQNLSRPVTIPAGEMIMLTAIYDPLAHGPNATGKVTRTLILNTNSSVTPTVEVRFDANVVKEG